MSSFGHESIEDALASAGFDEQQRKAIYFGNWLRDYSQLIDPKLVRAPDAPKDFPSRLSREVLTEVADLLALKAFHTLQDTEEGRRTYTVVPEMLGVYRPSEHIDNPANLDANPVDPRTLDPDFEPLVRPGDPRLGVDPDSSMKHYIKDSVTYMRNKLIDAMQEGPNPTGMRCFGEALHVLEDFFAHSNYVELTLRKAGHLHVLPWTTQAPCRHGLPVVTGLFSGSDVLASVAEPLAKALFPVNGIEFTPTQPGERSDAEQMLLILLKEHEDPQWLELLMTSLQVRDGAAGTPAYLAAEAISWALSTPLKAIDYVKNLVLQASLKLIGDSVDDLQTWAGNDPNVDAGTEPTHSQLAKDHDNHPFHDLASHLARYAVEEVGRSMYDYWAGNKDRDPVTLADSYIRHPNDSDWQDDIVAAWAITHVQEIVSGSSYSTLQELNEANRKAALERLRELEAENAGSLSSIQDSVNNIFPSFG
ncbi:hypothetical protein PS627_01833 [Pseudomonas fluorescens]|uniref:HET-C-related protein n=1 Tax=Pseudomonas fluorescens TaxID=294 RepID=UPI001259364F|nr:HET-C-related protein [Pseudomonas fluorescens]CAG8865997.1 hypothetical protein PS627_01833 [Pseudomonas fluorescens]VVP75887.1 hypothetical protein PS910_01488 [Pseudomonas fluorescens]